MTLLTVLAIAGIVLCAIAGAAWRRWLGAADTGPRSVKMIAGALLSVITLRVCGLPLDLALFAAVALLGLGWSLGHVFHPWHPLIWRYGAVTVAVGLLLWATGHGWGLLYAPLGGLAPLGYVAARRLGPSVGIVCWTCVGEAWLGALIYGGLPLAAFIGR